MATTKTVEAGSDAWLMRQVRGGNGLQFHLRATIVCESPPKRNGRACCVHDEFEDSAESHSLDGFREKAVKEFESRGWTYGMGGARCPGCARKRR